MEILVVNCNTSADMTRTIGAAAAKVARAGTVITPVTPTWGVSSAEGFYDSYLSAAAVLDVLTTWPAGFDAVVLAGFGEHGREGARQLLPVPVVDITEAAAMAACLLGQSFGVVTTTRTSVVQIRHSLLTAGLLTRCAGVVSADVRVLDLHDDDTATVAAFVAHGRRLVDEGADTLVLGCAGMAGLDRAVADEVGVPVVDGVAAAVGLCETLVHLGLATSKVGSYTPPELTKRRPRSEGSVGVSATSASR